MKIKESRSLEGFGLELAFGGAVDAVGGDDVEDEGVGVGELDGAVFLIGQMDTDAGLLAIGDGLVLLLIRAALGAPLEALL